MSEIENLLPCPFCGRVPEPPHMVGDSSMWSNWRIFHICTKIGVDPGVMQIEISGSTWEQCLEYWNRRTRPENKPIPSCPHHKMQPDSYCVKTCRIECELFEIRKPKTNFDRIAESPEALAKLIFSVIKNSEVCQCPAFTYCNGTGGANCEQTLIKWLKQPEQEEK